MYKNDKKTQNITDFLANNISILNPMCYNFYTDKTVIG